jgi:UDP-GlcNAc:undecaprenyl-phosphate GlcNAc-1-phosphate transferase
MTYLFVLLLLFLIELIYFKFATRFKITDRPNQRSSHSRETIRGGGIIFPLAMVLYFVFYNYHYPFFICGLILIATVSFLDDMVSLTSLQRILVHLISAGLLFMDCSVEPILIIPIMIVSIGALNIYNFMDGINGLTGAYSLVAFFTLLYINKDIEFVSEGAIVYMILALAVFVFFNFRLTAICFAGDVGSISIAFILLFFIIQLVSKTGNMHYLLLILVYGLDSISTIVFRIFRKENIFKAHRSHFYQFLANDKQISHLHISIGYALTQLLINLLIIFFLPQNTLSYTLLISITCIVLLIVRFQLEGRDRLLTKY